ncbi:hypothetical protein LguiB_030292 [Lonicera macranthoides]
MATNLLKKVWLSVSNHHCGGSSVPNQTAPPSPPYVMIRFGRRQVNSSAQPIVVSVPICQYDNTASAKAARRQLKEAIYSALFGVNVPAVCAINQATLALFAARRTSGIVVNIGFQQTSVVPILHGKVMRKVGVEVVGMGALNLTGFLREQMQQKNISFGSLYTVRSLKENQDSASDLPDALFYIFAKIFQKQSSEEPKLEISTTCSTQTAMTNLCYIALDYKAELSKDAEKSFEVAADGWLTLSRERCAMGLHQAVALCMDHCEDAELSGDGERLEKELQKLPPVSMSSGIGVIPPHYGSDSAWFGAKIVSNVR